MGSSEGCGSVVRGSVVRGSVVRGCVVQGCVVQGCVVRGCFVTPLAIRVGQGFDIHRFSDDPSRILVLGGVVFKGEPGLHGHSDADAVAHAVTDALLGAAGLGDIGQHFPDTDARWKGANSLMLLSHTSRMLGDAGWMVGNVDCSVVCEQPKLAPHRDEMQQRLSAAAGGPVTVKGRRAEGLGALGRREGIACWAVAIIHRADTEQFPTESPE